GGGKILLLERGAFAGVHAAMMVHPAPVDVVEPVTLAWWDFEVRYTGKSAHASAFPELGINAADALTVAQTAIGLLRQHIRQSDRAAASTDMGNVSHALPSIHPMIGIASLPAVNHQPEFTAHCVTAAADQTVADGALALAWTAVDVASDPAFAARLRARGQ